MSSPLPRSDTDDATTTTTRSTHAGRRLDIQGLRAVAVLVVVAFHAGLPVPGGFVGVDVFFVISGFVITAMLHREWLLTGGIRFRRFYLRRFKRLTPALALMVAVTVLLSALILSPFGTQQIAAKTAIGAILLVANFVIARTTGGYFDAPAETNPLLNTWSLSVEEQFYLGFPALIAFGWLIARRRGAFRIAPHLLVGAVAAVSFGLATLTSTGWTPSRVPWLLGFYSPFTRAWEFAIGALLALFLARRTLSSKRSAVALGVLGAAMLVASLWAITDTTPFPGPWTLLPVAGTALLLIVGTKDGNPVTRALSTRPMVKLGDWSYSVYLWHWPLIVFAALLWPDAPLAVLGAALLSFAPALASYRWVEQPIRLYVPRSPWRMTGLIAVTVLTPLALAGALLGSARAAWWLDWPSASTARQNDHVAISRGCTDRSFDPELCTWNSEGANGSVLLAGDSQAYALADGVIEAAARLGMSTTVTSRSGCPISTLETTGTHPLDCVAWQQEVLTHALSAQPDVVVMANRPSGYTRPESGWRTFVDQDGDVATTADKAAALYELGVRDVASILRDAGMGVVILQNPPELNRKAQELEPSIIRRFMTSDESESFDAATTLAHRQKATDVEASVASALPGTVLYDPIPVLCPDGTCPIQHDGTSIYLDEWHLTRDGSLLLAPSLEDAILKAEQQR